MPTLIIKEAPDLDFYVEWSSVTEAPTAAGTREQMLAHQHRQLWPSDNTPEMRLDRWDRTGTTAMWRHHAGLTDRPEEGSWDDHAFIYKQQGLIDRADIFTLARRLIADGTADVTDLLRPFDDAVVESVDS